MDAIAGRIMKTEASAENPAAAAAEKVARRLATRGVWDECVEDGVPPEIQPLHMPAACCEAFLRRNASSNSGAPNTKRAT